MKTDPLLLRALRCEPVERVPIWLMRQAGRYMPEYRAVREKIDFLSLCKNPPLCAEVMATAVDRIGVDAAIIFSDLLPILEPMGFDLVYAPGDGPIIRNPLRESADLARIREWTDLSAMGYVFETVSATRRAIPAEKAVIGFAGAPFTLAGYAIEGGTSREFRRTRELIRTQPDVWHEFLARLTRSIARYVTAQQDAGAEVVQIFDSWAGVLSVDEYQSAVLPHLTSLWSQLRADRPIIYFWTGNPALLPAIARFPVACIGVDHRVSLTEAMQTLSPKTALQGNLNPEVLLSDIAVIRREAAAVLEQAGRRAGYVFNLGHGVLKNTPVDSVKELVNFVKQWQR